MQPLQHILATGVIPASKNMARSLAHRLGVEIASGRYPEGDKLPFEPDLAELYGVSRTVVREAVRHLVAKGMLSVKPRAGTLVLQRSYWNMLDEDVVIWMFEAGSSADDFDDLNEIRSVFEPHAAEIAARRGSVESKARIMDAYNKMEVSVGMTNDFVHADAQFHIEILQASNNTYLHALRNVLYAGLLSSIHKTNSNTAMNKLSLPFHKKVADAISRGDTLAAREAMKNLLQDASNRLA